MHIRSFSKSHGPDLRLAAVGGAGDVVTAVENRRLLGPGWSSRILQSVLLELIRHPATAETLAAARAAYAERRRRCRSVLVDHGVDVTGTDGINLWMRVDDERAAVVALAAQGIGVAPGDPFLVRPDFDHLRVTVGDAVAERARRRGGRPASPLAAHLPRPRAATVDARAPATTRWVSRRNDSTRARHRSTVGAARGRPGTRR